MNIDELFEREELSAAPDSGWPDLFNSGLFVFRPSMETFSGLLQLAEKEGSFDGKQLSFIIKKNWSCAMLNYRKNAHERKFKCLIRFQVPWGIDLFYFFTR